MVSVPEGPELEQCSRTAGFVRRVARSGRGKHTVVRHSLCKVDALRALRCSLGQRLSVMPLFASSYNTYLMTKESLVPQDSGFAFFFSRG